MNEIDFMSVLHKSTNRDYLARVNDKEFPKSKAAELAKQYSFEYWDGDRRINYGGYKYIKNRWLPVAKKISDYYKLGEKPKILDVGCGKGFLLFEFLKILPEAEIYGLDISKYAIENCKDEIRDNLKVGNSNDLPWPDDYFDLVISINTLHNLYSFDLKKSLQEIERVAKKNKYICVESYRSEKEKANLLYWQVTCEAFNTPEEWLWWFEEFGYTGDYSFIYFE